MKLLSEGAAQPHIRIKACRRELKKLRMAVSRERRRRVLELAVGGSLDRAAHELRHVDLYLGPVREMLACASRWRPGDTYPAEDWVCPDIADRVLACAALVELALSDVKPRIRGSAALAGCAAQLEQVRRELAGVAGNLTMIFPHVKISPDALQAGHRTTELAQALEKAQTLNLRPAGN